MVRSEIGGVRGTEAEEKSEEVGKKSGMINDGGKRCKGLGAKHKWMKREREETNTLWEKDFTGGTGY
jgi:hypothetical protein